MLVLDSSFLLGYHNDRDAHHEAALRAMPKILAGDYGELLLPEYVFVEVTTVLSARRGIDVARRVGEHLLASRELRLVPGSDLFDAAWAAFRDQRAGQFSFTDAMIVALCQREGATRIATFDQDFRNLPDIEVIP